jgi:hypothetical protein
MYILSMNYSCKIFSINIVILKDLVVSSMKNRVDKVACWGPFVDAQKTSSTYIPSIHLG